MGGEWEFSFDGQTSTFDLETYQKMLKTDIYETYKNRTDWGENGQVRWAEEEPPTDNVFAKFTYDCTRHDWHHSPSWKLLWDPTKEVNISDVHSRCATFEFKVISLRIQEMLCKSFPDHFSLDLGDGGSGVDDWYNSRMDSYSCDYGDDSYSLHNFTACDEECGNCEQCFY